MAITLVPKRHSPLDKSDAHFLESAKAGISALVRSLRSFDVTTIERRDDWKANAFASLINTTLADIFGQNSREYEAYSVGSFDTLPPATDVEYPLLEVRQAYRKGIGAAAQRLNLLLDALGKESGVAEETAAPAPQAEATVPNSLDEKVSLVTMRARLKSRRISSAAVDGATPGHGKVVKARHEAGATVERFFDPPPGKPRPKESTAASIGRDSADIPGKNGKKRNQSKVGEGGLGGVEQEHEPIAAGQEEYLSPEHFESMQKAPEPEGFTEKESVKGEPWSAPIEAGEGAPVDMKEATVEAAVAATAADRPAAADLQVEVQKEDSQPGKEALGPVDEFDVPGDDESPVTDVIVPSAGESPLLIAPQEGLDAAENEEPPAEILAEPHHDIPPVDTTIGESALPQVLMLPRIALTPKRLLPKPEVEKGQETTLRIAETNPAKEISAEPFIEPSVTLVSLGPFKMAHLALTAGEKNGFQVSLFSAHPDKESTGDVETGLAEPTGQAIPDAVPLELLEEEAPTFEHGPSSHAVTEQAVEPPWHEIMAHELLSVEQWAGEPERGNRGLVLDAVEDGPPAICLEQAEEPAPVRPLDLSNVEALADKFAKEIADPPEPEVREVTGAPLPGDALGTPPVIDQCTEETPPGSTEDSPGGRNRTGWHRPGGRGESLCGKGLREEAAATQGCGGRRAPEPNRGDHGANRRSEKF